MSFDCSSSKDRTTLSHLPRGLQAEEAASQRDSEPITIEIFSGHSSSRRNKMKNFLGLRCKKKQWEKSHGQAILVLFLYG
jgi:hypothetical protein